MTGEGVRVRTWGLFVSRAYCFQRFRLKKCDHLLGKNEASRFGHEWLERIDCVALIMPVR